MSRISFTSGELGVDGSDFLPDVYVMNADGSGVEQLTENGLGNILGAWSPDGDRVLFTSEA